ncbi:hypothetical protein [Persephonella sp.]|uniref:hypothetical protein n=1 Tax=Persephonella sp. TaxID=2060922 RepID=UPI00262DCA5A|nr:hypothetical protein [Persephonella sp.]
MGFDEKLKQILDRLYTETGASFSGIFRESNSEIIKTIYPGKKKNLSELIKLIIERGHQTNEIIEDFGEEYIYAEGEDISIFVIFVTPEISIASIVEGDTRFALLKLVHVAAAKKIRQFLTGPEEKTETEESIEQPKIEEIEKPKEIPEEKPEEKSFEEFIKETPEVVPLEKEIPEISQEEKNEITIEDVRDKFAEELEAIEETEKEELPQDIHELESVLSSPQEIEEEKGEEEKISEEEIPTLEEILGVSELPQQVEQEKKEEIIEEKKETETEPIFHNIEEFEYYDPSVLDKIKEVLVMEIGPIGNFLFKKRLKELNINPEKITQKDLDNLIKKLLTDIIDTNRRENFIKKTSKFL